MNRSSKKGWYWLLLIPFIGTCIPNFYATAEPSLWGFPFFYWYQILWIFISSALTYLVYRATKE
ncbi:MAG: DUF3311 domain-containing protein [Alicyclobacillus sp.]|nr:DUF3311 domain-containing protein [Alicyclobacillus sp.]